MFDQNKLDALPATPSALPDIDKLGIEELLALRDKIDGMLPPTRLAEVDLEAALLLQHHRSQALLAKVLGESSGVPANQKAQVANSCAATLGSLIKMQGDLYNQERIKTIESALIKALKTLPKEAQAVFVEVYERVYGEASMSPRL